MLADGEKARLWAPWRMEYVLDEKKSDTCIFCDKPGENKDRENLILSKGKNVFVIMNRYPYNNGHIMITPYSHVSDIGDLTSDEIFEISMEVKKSVLILGDVMRPEGFNVGMNIGKAAGAGIDDHIHMHVVPRWNGDTNFMPVISDVRVMPEHLDNTYMKIFSQYKNGETGDAN